MGTYLISDGLTASVLSASSGHSSEIFVILRNEMKKRYE